MTQLGILQQLWNYIERKWTKKNLEKKSWDSLMEWLKYCNNFKMRMDKNEYGKNPSRFTNETIGFIVTIQNYTKW